MMRVRMMVLVVAATLAGRGVMAETTPDAKKEAHDRFAQGLRLFDKGDNAAALAEFKRAYELVPNPLVLYNMGLVYAAMDRPVEAVEALEKFLKEGDKAAAGEPGRRARQTLDEASKRVAEVMVVTNKPAAIEIDGVNAGTTPLERPLRVASGAHVVSAQAPGYLPLRQSVTLAGQVKETMTLNLLPAESTVAHLAITVSVPGAEVLVNGKSVGTTPLPANVAVSPGTASVEVRRAGYRPSAQTVRVDEGSSGALALTLDEDPAAPASVKGRLRLTINEPGAELAVDGVSKPIVTDGIAAIAGPHRLRVERAGFVVFERSVDVVAGRDTSLVVNLIPTPETTARRDESRHIWGWSVVAAGAALAAGVAVYAVVTHNDVANAQASLDGQFAIEMTPTELCSSAPSNAARYKQLGCGERKAYFQGQVDSANLHRNLAYAGVGLGVVVAGVGTYFAVTRGSAPRAESATAQVGFWSDGRGAGLTAAGRF